MASARVRAKTLSVARSILRHLRDEVHNVAGFPPQQNVSQWSTAVLDSYRAAMHAEKAAARTARAQATEFLDYLRAIKEQRGLIVQYGQVDIDSKAYREAAAARVGLTIPDKVPLQAQDYAAKYELATKMTKLKGVAGLKAQLYGLESVLPDSASKKAESGSSFDDLLR